MKLYQLMRWPSAMKSGAKYRDVAVNPHGTFHFHTGRPLARHLGYDVSHRRRPASSPRLSPHQRRCASVPSNLTANGTPVPSATCTLNEMIT